MSGINGHIDFSHREGVVKNGDATDGDLVIVMFPSDAWQSVIDLALRIGVHPPEALSMAIKMLADSVDKVTK